MFLFLSLPVF